MIDLGKLTEQETAELAAEALSLLTDEVAIRVIQDWAQEFGMMEELIASLERF